MKRMIAIGAVVLCGHIAGTLSYAATIRVPSEQPTIQAGIDAASNGDTVLVAPGAYTGAGNRDIGFGGKAILVVSVSGAAQTIINCEGTSPEPHRAFYFQSGELSDAILRGFTVTGGYYASGSTGYGGSAILAEGSSPTIDSCVISGNGTDENWRGACNFVESQARLSDCEISGNQGWGVVTHASEVALHGCRVLGNESGGVRLQSQTIRSEIDNCTFSQNNGTGLDLYDGAATVSGCRFSGNGQGMHVFTEDGWTYLTVSHCVFEDNGPTSIGAGLCFQLAPLIGDASLLVEHCTFSGNSAVSGGAVYAAGYSYSGPFVIRQSTFSANISTNGAQIYCSLSPITNGGLRMERVILAHGVDGPSIHCAEGSEIPDLVCCDLFGNDGGDWTGCVADQATIYDNFSADPRFCDPGAADYGLGTNSPCLPAASPCGQLVGAVGESCGPVYRPWWVATDGDDASGLGTESKPFATIQHGIDMSSDGDTVMLKPGTYQGDGNWGIDMDGKAIVLTSQLGSASTALLGNVVAGEMPSGIVLNSSEDSQSVIQGLTFTMNDPSMMEWNYTGGAIRCVGASPTIRNNVFLICEAEQGGSIYLTESAAIITNCEFRGRKTVDYTGDRGGAVTAISSNPVISGCLFDRLWAHGQGGALYGSNSTITLSNCELNENTAGNDALRSSSASDNGENALPIGPRGGAISLVASVLVASDCTFQSNVADGGDGGAIMADATSSLSLENCVLVHNAAYEDFEAASGGAIYGSGTFNSCVFGHNGAISSGGAVCGSANCTDCLFYRNAAGTGSSIFGGVSLLGCTFAFDYARYSGVVYLTNGSNTVTDCIFAFNSFYEDSPGNHQVVDGCATLSCCDMFGNQFGDWTGCVANQQNVRGNMSSDPQFCDPSAGNYTLRSNSPCLPDWPQNLCHTQIGSESSGCGCCYGRVGDANGSGDDMPTIGDVSVMIDAKFITGECILEGAGANIRCLAEADANLSGGTNPTCDDITIGDISMLIDCLFITGEPPFVRNECL